MLGWDHNDFEVKRACDQAEFKGKLAITLSPIVVAAVYLLCNYGDYKILGSIVVMTAGFYAINALLKDEFLFSRVPGFFFLMSILASIWIFIRSFVG